LIKNGETKPKNVDERLEKSYAEKAIFEKAEKGLKHFYEVMKKREFSTLVALEISGYDKNKGCEAGKSGSGCSLNTNFEINRLPLEIHDFKAADPSKFIEDLKLDPK